MLKIAFAVAALGAGAATAQTTGATSTVALYGSLDAGFTHIDNVRGQRVNDIGSGSKLANRVGFRGSEDLGGGLKAVFLIEGGMNVDEGTLTLGGRPWGRQSYVGVSHASWGTLTIGRQYDFLYAGSPGPLDLGALLIGGLAGATGGAGTSVDNHLGGVRYDNTVKWLGNRGPWSAGVMYGRGTDNGRDKMANAVLAWRADGVWLGGTYLQDNFSPAASGNRITALGANVDVGPAWTLVLNASSSRAHVAADTRSRNHMVQAGVLCKITRPWMAGVMLGHSSIRNAADQPGRLRQLGLGTAYLLSRRTELYGIVSQLRSSGSAGTAYSGVPGIGAPAAQMRSDGDRQGVYKAGIRHSF